MAEPIVNLPGEIWKPVVGYEGLYDVSDRGRIKSLTRVIQRADGRQKTIHARILKTCTSRTGHKSVQLGRGRRQYAHRLVLEAFVGPCPEGMECCHNDGDPANNRLENLRWDTRRNNSLDAMKHGTWHRPPALRGERAHNAIFTADDIRAIRNRVADGDKQTAVAACYGVAQGVISNIVLRKSWRHIT